ncbi:PREDICTED: heterodimeric geranylgeranyl pyrophosphate synthase small subunit, chloroplastic-like [Camelina sativa]|uniref:Heterodimeric geranylgeranyl pyrophosphate synthase small subunit, chloroplastic-like n=1 Tax=Camelina sativa TaxID=90675 RepID=A0ABM1QHD6_CAMSA|nr:PREDICTED: heterodimeric geranylgeranyl pyrophosphate synthase small subunit, chloroplastic-like [Camelina sativa]
MLFSASATPLVPSLCFLAAEKPVNRRPMMMRLSGGAIGSSNFDLRTYWGTLMSEINQKLDEAIPVKYPAGIYEAMRYSVLAQGAKRAPPVMCVAACELFGGDRLAAFPTACALEMFVVIYK